MPLVAATEVYKDPTVLRVHSKHRRHSREYVHRSITESSTFSREEEGGEAKYKIKRAHSLAIAVRMYQSIQGAPVD